MKQTFVVWLLLSVSLQAGESGDRVRYVGGTVAGMKSKSGARLDVLHPEQLAFRSKDVTFEVPYRNINTLEYGMHVSRRYVAAVFISPVFLVAKKRSHFLTIGYQDLDGRQQAMVLEVDKNGIRPLLVSLEARTGRRVEFQDEEARKAGKG